MWLPKASRSWLATLAALLLLAGCAYVKPSDFSQRRGAGEGTLVLWFLSDIQPPTDAERRSFEQAVADINTLSENIQVGVMAGDLLKSRSQPEDFQWFLGVRNRARVGAWYEIAGNHDVRSSQYFPEYFPNSGHFKVEIGNLVLLLLSDESQDSATHISDEAFRWWREEVIANQDKTIITVTHAQLKNSGLIASSVPSRQVVGSERFAEVLKNYRVRVWASGHSHLPQGLSGMVSQRPELGGTYFINVGCIYENRLMASQSRLFYLDAGSSTLWIRSRNHSEGQFEKDLTLAIELGTTFSWDGSPPRYTRATLH